MRSIDKDKKKKTEKRRKEKNRNSLFFIISLKISKKSPDRSSRPPDLLEIEKQRIEKNIISLFFIISLKISKKKFRPIFQTSRPFGNRKTEK
jgi:hypothetical protein